MTNATDTPTATQAEQCKASENTTVECERPTPTIRIPIQVLWEIGRSIASRPAESGGMLGGSEHGDEISRFVFDESSANSGMTYEPNIKSMQAILEQWRPEGVRFRGFCHSHPPGCRSLSGADIEYIGRLLMRCPYLEYFFAPIVLPDEQSFVPWIVYRDRPNEPVLAELVLI